jgi:hypothetical protein
VDKCKQCGGNFKLSVREHVIETRHTARPRLVIENLPVMECTICANIHIPDSSAILIDSLNEKILREMREMAEEAERPKGTLWSLRQTLKNWIS